ncbi:Uncharacterized protein TPAR_05447 [Tolypocladium paradoxum]|uniref:Xylanolytic transcriptional activator regulatory domain-containing protein n=1 Tax=Tolypocladium paradoxum TaxID=94208 RepID=A0A2S4KW18_9HYPO|nr:Uncharacterized protein TPAR_05447 [Tolypocladium paradoxum]
MTSGDGVVYVGSSAAISFLQFLRNTLRHHGGPSDFTESLLRHAMLEADAYKSSPAESFEDHLDHESKMDLAKHYLEATSGFMSIHTHDQVEDLVTLANDRSSNSIPDSWGTGDSSMAGPRQDRLASLYLVLAIGACCRGQGDVDARTSSMYFTQGQQLSFRSMLHDPTCMMVNNFLLMAFYMFCACRRNTSLLYLGISAKAATILGLHLSESFVSHDAEETNIAHAKSRTWESLRILDLHCNIILGRPTSITAHSLPQMGRRHGVRTGTNPSVHDSDASSSHREAAVNANYDLCAHLEDISLALMKRGSLDLGTAEGFLQKLRDWAKALPGGLREGISRGARKRNVDNSSSTPSTSTTHRQRTIGNLHVACGYYFGVLLITRPFLVACVIPTLQQVQRPESFPDGARAPTRRITGREEIARVKELSQVCLGAAVYMMQMCKDAHSLDLLLDNMCVLQAWVLAAGLVLGFSLLVPGETLHPDARRAFTTARKVTARMSRLSPQAQRNHEILTAFSDAIELYRDKVLRRMRSPRDGPGSAYLEQILRPAAPEGEQIDLLPDDRIADERGGGEEVMDMPGVGQRPDGAACSFRGPEVVVPGTTASADYVPPPERCQKLDKSLANTHGSGWNSSGWAGGLDSDVSDEMGFQQFWDEYVDTFETPPASEVLSWMPWESLGS